SPFYNMPFSIRFSGELDIEHLRRALDTVVDRHDALRTRFVVVDGTPVQQVVPHAAVTLPVMDLAALSVTDRDGEVRRLALAEAAAPFDLAADRL
ncbi:condensation domain-containing protein, partial [Massilia sp. Root335]|uniref:condensation domain-containing protein n=1 Tax=Massilia sp. Root335 TaxID=1736517 RepID=UPI00138F4C6E